MENVDCRFCNKIYDGRTLVGISRCFGTFGELLQGVLSDCKRQFLVTLPIAQYSTAHFTALPDSDRLLIFPSHKQKVRQLAEKLIQLFDLKMGGILYIQSELVEGKGCASSSADMVAAALAMQSVFGFSISASELARIMASIEPSDGVMYQGVVSFYHREGILHKFLGYLPPLTIIALDEGGQVDTTEFNARPRLFDRAEQLEYENLLYNIEQAISGGDLRTLGKIATRSAVLNQKMLPKVHLNFLLDLSERYDILGVVAAHSGTYIGLLLDPASPTYFQNLSAISSELAYCSCPINIYYTYDYQRER